MDLVKFRKARSEARRVVWRAKKAWLVEKAEEVEKDKFWRKEAVEMHQGHAMWQERFAFF